MQKLSTVRIVNIVVFIQFRILPILISQTPFRFLNQFYRIGKVAIHLIDFLLLAFNIIYRSSVFYLVPDINPASITNILLYRDLKKSINHILVLVN